MTTFDGSDWNHPVLDQVDPATVPVSLTTAELGCVLAVVDYFNHLPDRNEAHEEIARRLGGLALRVMGKMAEKLDLWVEWRFTPVVSAEKDGVEYMMQTMPGQADGGDWFWLKMMHLENEEWRIAHVLSDDEHLTLYFPDSTLILNKPDKHPYYYPIQTIIDQLKEGEEDGE